MLESLKALKIQNKEVVDLKSEEKNYIYKNERQVQLEVLKRTEKVKDSK